MFNVRDTKLVPGFMSGSLWRRCLASVLRQMVQFCKPQQISLQLETRA